MKFLLDENISPKTAAFLRELVGLEVIHALGAGLKGKPDSDVYEFCKNEGYVLVTFDHEFGFEYLSKKDIPALVIVRIHPQTMKNIHPAMKNFFLEVKAGKLELKNRIAVIEKDRIRLRNVG